MVRLKMRKIEKMMTRQKNIICEMSVCENAMTVEMCEMTVKSIKMTVKR